MKFSLIDRDAMVIEHFDEPKLVANISEFSKTKLITMDHLKGQLIDPFVEINAFIANKISIKDQDRLFNAYKEALGFLHDPIDIIQLTNKVNAIMKTIYDIIKVQDIEDYMEENNLFNIPPDIKEEFAGEYSEERTYNRSKYKGLISLCIAARMPLPIWGELSPLRKSSVGNSRLPITLLRMLAGSSILESKQFKDFELYCSSTVEAGSHDKSLIAAGMGTEYNVMINLAANFVKKVAVGLNLASQPLAQTIYNFIANNGAYGGPSMRVMREKNDISGEEEKSVIEKYAMRERISQGDICAMEYYFQDCFRSMKMICPDIPEEYTDDATDLADVLIGNDFIVTPINLTLLQWIMGYVVPPEAFHYIGYSFTCNALASAAYIMKWLGFHDIACLLVARELKDEDGTSVSFKTQRKELPADIIEALDHYYPIKPIVKDHNHTGNNNVASIAITEYFTTVNNSVFNVVGDAKFLEYLQVEKILNKHMCFTIDRDFGTKLAQMIIKINEIEETRE